MFDKGFRVNRVYIFGEFTADYLWEENVIMVVPLNIKPVTISKC